MKRRAYNFSAGPSVLPEKVLEKARSELTSWHGCGMSVMEMSHREKEFVSIAKDAEARLRSLMRIPEEYHVLFLQGGASLQFSAIPMNILRDKSKMAYIETGTWSEKAIKAARQYGTVSVIASSKADAYTTAPDLSDLPLDDSFAYVHYTPNETIHGVRIFDIPDTKGIPLVADMSSMILSEPIDVTRFGLIYAGAQKNVGPAGVTIVIVRKDLCGASAPTTPDVLDYSKQAKDGSMINTPPCFAWYMAGLVFEWIETEGGIEVMHARARSRATTLYGAIDGSKFYRNPVKRAYRSLMNIPFVLKDQTLDEQFLVEAGASGLQTLAGHRSVGGMRASLYNAMPQSGVEALVEFMRAFEKEHETA